MDPHNTRYEKCNSLLVQALDGISIGCVVGALGRAGVEMYVNHLDFIDALHLDGSSKPLNVAALTLLLGLGVSAASKPPEQ